jgi:hypothetical protein
MSPAKKRSAYKKPARKVAKKRKPALELPRTERPQPRRCLTCGEWFNQPDLYWIHMDCPPCLEGKGIPRWLPPHLR